MSIDNETQNETAKVTEPAGYALGSAVARVVAEHCHLQPHQITELHITGQTIAVGYGLRYGPRPDEVEIRTRRIHPETGDTISDMPGIY